MAMALFGLWPGLGGAFRDLPDVLGHFHLAHEIWAAVIYHLGDPGNSIGLFSAIPRGALVAACGAAVSARARPVDLRWRPRRWGWFGASANESCPSGQEWRRSSSWMRTLGILLRYSPWRQWVEARQQRLRLALKVLRASKRTS